MTMIWCLLVTFSARKIKETSKPVFVKLSPDIDNDKLADVVETIVESGCRGIIISNTSTGISDMSIEHEGGLSGDMLWWRSFNKIRIVLDATNKRIPVIGSGGISDSDKVNKLLGLGCEAIQLYTGLVYKGPGLISQINIKINKKS